MAPPSIFRGPDAKHFAVVHRSQRDPLINDPEASERVLHEVQRQNETNKQRKKLTKGITRDELESSLGEGASTLRPNVGEASMYSIYYDDSEYDYMQHLKPVGLSTEAVLLEKISTANDSKLKPGQSIQLRAASPGADQDKSKQALRLPNSVQPSSNSEMLSYQDHLQYALPSNSAIPDDGFLPVDDDPALREVLEALEDEAYVEEEAGDEFFGTIVQDGERDPYEEPEWINEITPAPEPSSQWESEMARFKPLLSSSNSNPLQTASSAGSLHEPTTTTSKFKQPRSTQRIHPPSARGSMAGSAFSMSSSAMFRNEGLTDLDDRFDQIEKEYESSDTESDGSDDGKSEASNQTATPGQQTRADLEEIMDEFLDRFEVLGGKMKPVMSGKTPVDKLDTLRTELLGPTDPDCDRERLAVKEQILNKLKADQLAHDARLALPSQSSMKERFMTLEDDHQNKWDCQTILSTYSNLENHPRVIRIRDAIGASERKTRQDSSEKGPVVTDAKIRIDRATGFPIVNGRIIKGNLSSHNPVGTTDQEDDDSGSDGDSSDSVRGIIKRDRNEDKEAKKARKAQLKAERASRRQLKKNTKLTFAHLKNTQDKLAAKVLVQKATDIAGSGGKGVMTLL